MSDEPRHPVVQSMIDAIEEVLEPEKFAARRAAQPIQPPKQIEMILDPELILLLQLMKMGVDPKDLFPDVNEEDDGVPR